MLKSPLDYFAAQDFSPSPRTVGALTESEALFMRKYLGVGDMTEMLQASHALPVPLVPGELVKSGSIVHVLPEEASSLALSADAARAVEVSANAPLAAASVHEDEEAALQQASHVQFVGFSVGSQQYTIPTSMVQEVIRDLPISRLPMVSPLVSGVINLRGRVVPLIRLGAALGLPEVVGQKQKAFTIIGRGQGLLVGMQVDRVHSMHRIAQESIQWNVETTLGVNGECVSGLFLLDERIVPILSVQRIVALVLSK